MMMNLPSKINYAEILEIGVNYLQLSPRDVWQLTVDEFLILVEGKSKRLGGNRAAKGITQERAQELLEKFPDRGPEQEATTTEAGT